MSDTGNFMFIVSLSFTHAHNVIISFSKSLLDMANPYTIELRWRIVWIYLTLNHSVAEIAALFCVSERTVWRYIALCRQTGDVELQQRPKRMLGDLHLILTNSWYLLIRNPNKAGESVWSSCKHSNYLQDSAINGLHPSSHTTCHHPALRHP